MTGGASGGLDAVNKGPLCVSELQGGCLPRVHLGLLRSECLGVRSGRLSVARVPGAKWDECEHEGSEQGSWNSSGRLQLAMDPHTRHSSDHGGWRRDLCLGCRCII